MVRIRAREPEDQSIAEGVDRVFRHLLVLMVLLGLCLAIVFTYLLGFVRPDFTRYRAAGRALDLAHASMLDQETGLRGYLLVHDRKFLEPYDDGLATLHRQDVELTRTLGSDPDLAPLLLAMRIKQQAWASEWAAEVLAGRLPADTAGVDAFFDRGKELFDKYRSAELVLRDALWDRRDTLYDREGEVLAGGVVSTALLGSLALAALMRHRRRLKEAVLAPVVGIVSATEAIARHDLSADLEPSGPAEFKRIGESINVMRDALAAARETELASQERIRVQDSRLRNILAMSREISGSLNRGYVLRTVATSAATVSGFPRVIVWLADDPGATTLSAVYDSMTDDGHPAEDLKAEIGVGVVGQAVRYGRTATENADRESSVRLHPEQSLRTVAIPLVVGARVSGAIELSSPEPYRMSDGDLEVVEMLATHAAAAIEAASLHSDTEELAHTDALTGLANRRRLDHDLALECERSARYQRPLGFIMLDVDHFKRVNDAQGHARGDEILQELAEVIRHNIRSTDTAYRYGGEEFAVLARETEHLEAAHLAERLRSSIEQHFAARGSRGPVTASFGYTLVPPQLPVASQVVSSADAALYCSKAEGRNRVTGPAPSVL
jgi:diguanylate cyclase (GGDEF)-like protein